MNIQIAKVCGLVVLLLGLIGGLAFAIHANADPVIVGGLSTAIGVGAAAAFQWFTGAENKSGPAAVLLVAGTIIGASNGCAPVAVDTNAAEVVRRADE